MLSWYKVSIDRKLDLSMRNDFSFSQGKIETRLQTFLVNMLVVRVTPLVNKPEPQNKYKVIESIQRICNAEWKLWQPLHKAALLYRLLQIAHILNCTFHFHCYCQRLYYGFSCAYGITTSNINKTIESEMTQFGCAIQIFKTVWKFWLHGSKSTQSQVIQAWSSDFKSNVTRRQKSQFPKKIFFEFEHQSLSNF